MIGLLFNEEHREASLVFYTTPKTITHKAPIPASALALHLESDFTSKLSISTRIGGRSQIPCIQNKDARGRYDLGRRLIGGGYLLSHFRSTIGAAGFNFSVRNGKRWNPRAMAALISLKKEHYTGSFMLPVLSA